jgi:hypothetical protein
MARHHGKHGIILLSTTQAGVPTQTISLTSWGIDMSTDLVEVTAFGDPNKVYVQGLKDIKGTIGGWWDDSDDTLFEASESIDGCFLYLYPSADVPGKMWYGPAWMSASINTDVKDAVGVTGTFAAAGAWGRV